MVYAPNIWMHKTGKDALKYDIQKKKRYNHNHYTSKHATSYNEHKFNSQQCVPGKCGILTQKSAVQVKTVVSQEKCQISVECNNVECRFHL